MIRLIVFLLLLLNVQLTDSGWLKLTLLAGAFILYIKEIAMVLSGAAAAISSIVGKILGIGIVIGIFGIILLPLAAIIKYGGGLFRLNVAWSDAYANSFAIFIIGSFVWLAWSSIKRHNKIQSLFPLEQAPTKDDIKWIRSDLDRKERNLKEAVESHLINGSRYASEYRDLMDALRFLDETIQKFKNHDLDDDLLNRLNEIYLYDRKKYDTKLRISLI
ncbi:hypothetical protein ACE41H_21315 [Paenibacillus enshidis]|uniref:Uncharacterized protein n=1 Tax=Paenibacillus enshidis TaxID=1458439 RepID=A0ABV5B100_9BACL